MDWLLLTMISVLFRSFYGVMTKVLSSKVKVSIYTQAIVLPLAAAIIALFLSPLLGGLHFDLARINIAVVLLVVLGQGLGNIAYFAAIKNLTNGTAQIAFSSILIFNTILALLFLSLHLSFINIVGLFLLILAILIVVTGRVEFHRQGVGLMVLSAFLFAVFQLASSELSKQVSAATYLITAYLGAAVVVFIVKSKTVIDDLSKAKDFKSTFGIPLMTAIPSLGNFLFAYFAYRSAPEPAKVAMLLTSQVVLTVMLSYILLNEKGHVGKKLIAAILVVIAAILIKFN